MLRFLSRSVHSIFKSGCTAAAGFPKAIPGKARLTQKLSAAALAAGFAACGVAYADDGEMIIFSGNANKELAQVRFVFHFEFFLSDTSLQSRGCRRLSYC